MMNQLLRVQKLLSHYIFYKHKGKLKRIKIISAMKTPTAILIDGKVP
jgi:hypothetical protein